MGTRVLVKDRYYIPSHKLDHDTVKKTWSVPWETKKFCRETCMLKDQRGRYCATCPSKDAHINMFEKVVAKSGNKYWAVPAGSHELLKEAGLRGIEFDDRRPIIPFRHKQFEWTNVRPLYKGQFAIINGERRRRPNQRAMVKAWLDHTALGYTGGMIVSPPRSGKTVIGIAAIMSLEVRTLIMASQIGWLRQFCKRFTELTNVARYHRDTGRYPIVLIDPEGWPDAPKCIKVIKKWSDIVNKADVVLSSYQGLINVKTGERKLEEYVYNKFSFLVVDEVHQSSALAFSKLINHLMTRYRLGLTATVQRKDKLHPVAEAILGRPVYIGEITAQLPQLELFETGCTYNDYKQWHRLEAAIAKHEARNIAIVRQVFRDLRENKRNSILLPVSRVQHILTLVRMINSQALYNNKHRNENWPTDLAIPYKGGIDVDKTIQQVSAMKARVVVARNSMVQMGLDVERWTHVYIGAVPTSNAPMMYQLGNRVCTAYEGKPTPIIRFMIDATKVSVYCFKKIYEDMAFGINAGLIGKGMDREGRLVDGPIRYKTDSDTRSRMHLIAKFPKSYSPVDVGVQLVTNKTAKGKVQKSLFNPLKTGVKRF